MDAHNATRDLMQKKMDHNHGALRKKGGEAAKKVTSGLWADRPMGGRQFGSLLFVPCSLRQRI
jgi:hypothetical protein